MFTQVVKMQIKPTFEVNLANWVYKYWCSLLVKPKKILLGNTLLEPIFKII